MLAYVFALRLLERPALERDRLRPWTQPILIPGARKNKKAGMLNAKIPVRIYKAFGT